MKLSERNLDISHNIKMIEWLKSELVANVASLFKSMLGNSHAKQEMAIGDIAANIITTCYLLCKRLGISYGTVDLKIRSNLDNNASHELEKKYGDLSELLAHLDSTRKVSYK